MTGQKDNGTVTQPPTDFELFEIEAKGIRENTEKSPGCSARRALYDAGRVNGYGQGTWDAQARVDWLKGEEAVLDLVDFWHNQSQTMALDDMAREFALYLHARIVGGADD